jgi:hypothetical protein
MLPKGASEREEKKASMRKKNTGKKTVSYSFFFVCRYICRAVDLSSRRQYLSIVVGRRKKIPRSGLLPLYTLLCYQTG